jgi:hypothetical protein
MDYCFSHLEDCLPGIDQRICCGTVRLLFLQITANDPRLFRRRLPLCHHQTSLQFEEIDERNRIAHRQKIEGMDFPADAAKEPKTKLLRRRRRRIPPNRYVRGS